MDKHIKEALSQMRVIDYETTDLDPFSAEVLETGIALFNGEDWEMFGQLYKPSGSIPIETQEVTHIHPSMVEDCDEFAPAKQDFFQYMDEGYIVAHNSKYEQLVTRAYGKQIEDERFICTLRWAKKVLTGLEHYRLPWLRYYLDLSHDCPEHHSTAMHRAHHDAFFTGKLAQTLIDIMVSRGMIEPGPGMIDEIANYVQAPIIYDKVPFGKHRGKDFVSVPKDYWQWCLENMDSLNPDNELTFDQDLTLTILDAIES